jgi:hypothetical protein
VEEKATSGKPRVKKSNAEDDQLFALFAMRFALYGQLSVVLWSVSYQELPAAICYLLTSDTPCA